MAITPRKAQLMSASEIDRTLVRLAHEILEKTKDLDQLAFIGIRRRGVPLAQRLSTKIGSLENRNVPVGILDINLYRDDLSTVDVKPVVSATEIPFSVAGKDIILVDDVLYTGRTIRAALDALFDHGRPARVQLLVLIDRGHRELPIEARFVGRKVQTSDNEIIEVKFQEIDGMEKVLLVERAGVARHASRIAGDRGVGPRRDRCHPGARQGFPADAEPELEEARHAARQNDRQSVLLKLPPARGPASKSPPSAGRGRRFDHRLGIQRQQGRIAGGHAEHLRAMRPDAIVMRHAASGAPHFLARHLPTPIINAGDGTHEHPHASATRRTHHSGPLRAPGGPQGCHHRRHRAQPRGAQQRPPAL